MGQGRYTYGRHVNERGKRMATKKKQQPIKKDWPPMRQDEAPVKPEQVIKRYVPKWDEQELIRELARLSGMNQELAEQIAKDNDRPDNAGELAEKYKLSEMDAEAILAVLNG